MDEEGDSSRPSDLTVPPSRDGWRLILSTLRQQWRGIAVGVVVGLVWTAAKVAVPWLVQQAIDLGITPGDLEALRTWTIAIVIAAAVAATFTGLRRYWAFRESRRLETVLRDRLFAHVQRLHFAFHDRVQTGDLMSRANTDLQQVQNVVVLIPLTISNAVTVLAVAVLLVSIDPVLTVLALGSLPFLNLLGKRFSNRLHPTMIGLQRESAALATVVEESVSGIRAVKGFGAEELQRRRLATEADDIYDVAMRASRIRASFLPAMELLPNIGLIFVLGYGGWQVIAGQLSLGSLIAFNVYVALLIWPLRMLGMIIAQGQRAAASAQRVHEVLDTAPEITAPAHPQHLPARPEPASVATGVGRIELDAVRFGYGRPHPVLDGLDLVIEPGESVALVGATGSGKSTVARLLCRFYDVEAGAVRLDGVDVRDLDPVELRRAISIVFEETFLFSDTLAANIAFGRPDATDAEIHRAAELAGAASFIADLDDGYASLVGERGHSLSGGQRQRIAIARAILADPRVLILDDATSAVDPTKEHEIRDALGQVMAHRTTLVIAHRPATIALADRVVLLHDGRVAAQGTHHELLASSAAYRQVLATAHHDPTADAGDTAAASGGGDDPASTDGVLGVGGVAS
ncbi:MAG: ABC transporter ATP-binding protein [Acidimicrobiales bacterium]|nr:ABC transporter ATP-binding protein [Acidimicrobiales bacterium]